MAFLFKHIKFVVLQARFDVFCRFLGHPFDLSLIYLYATIDVIAMIDLSWRYVHLRRLEIQPSEIGCGNMLDVEDRPAYSTVE